MPRVIEKTIYKFEELPEEIQDKIIEKFYDINIDHDWWDYDGMLDLSEKEIEEAGITKEEYQDLMFSYKTVYFSAERGRSWYIQFPDLTVENEEVFRKWLRIPKELWEKVYYSFHTPSFRDSTTTIALEENDPEDEFTEEERKILERAKDIFDDKVEEALGDLEKNYDYLTSREAIVETIEANEYEFDEYGNLE